jgi:hypothetical protein
MTRGRLPVALLAIALVSIAVVSSGAVNLPGGVPRDCAFADSAVRVGVVIDFGVLVDEQHAPASVGSSCTAVDDGANGFQILDASHHTYTVNGSGLLCAIDGFPNTGECGTRTATGYRYWAYFHGSSGGWTYSGQGPGDFQAHASEVEGWRFVEGKGNPTDPAPRGPHDPAQVCPPVPTTKPPVVTNPLPSIPGNATTTPASVPRPGGNASTPPSAASPGGATTTVAAGEPAAGIDPETGSPGSVPDGDATAPEGEDDDRSVGSTAPDSGDGTDPGTERGDVALASTPSSSSGSGVPVAAILVVVLIAGFGGAAALRFRADSEHAS